MNILNKSQNVRAIHDTDSSLPLTIGQSGMLGGNIAPANDYSSFRLYASALLNSRGFGVSPALNFTLPPLDAEGWPTTASSIVMQDASGVTGNLPPGTYLMQYDSVPAANVLATLTGSAGGGATLTFTSTATAVNGDITRFCTLTVTNMRTIFLNFSAAVRNLIIMRPGYPLTTTDRLCVDAVKYCAQFPILRSMDFLETNRKAPSGLWVNRTQQATYHGTTSGEQGNSIEDLILLCNEAKATPGNMLRGLWFNMTHNADDDYITRACTMLKDTLDPNLIIYLELGNESWNGQFTAITNYFATIAIADSSLNFDASAIGTLRQRAYVKRVRQMALLAETVFGTGSLNTKVRVVIGTQQFGATDQLKYLARAFTDRPISSYIYALAGAPYIGLGDTTVTGKTTTEYIQALYYSANIGDNSIAACLLQIKKGKELAACYGIKVVCYEGGTGGTGFDTGTPETTLIAYNAQLDPGMRKLVSDFVIGAISCGIETFCWYHIGPKFMSSTNPNSFWPANQDISIADPKLHGLLDALQIPIPTPSQILARNKIRVVGTSTIIIADSGTRYYSLLSPGDGSGPYSGGIDWYAATSASYYAITGNMTPAMSPWVDFGIYVEEAGNYSLTLFAGATGTAVINYAFLLDGLTIGAVVITPNSPNTYGKAACLPGPTITVALPQGWHALRVAIPVIAAAVNTGFDRLTFTKI